MSQTNGALVFVGQVAVIAGACLWVAYCTKAGRQVRQGLRETGLQIRRRRQEKAHAAVVAAWERWVRQVAYWGHERDRYAPGTPSHELAQDMINILEKLRPPHPGPCPYVAFTCPHAGRCPNHPRSHQP